MWFSGGSWVEQQVNKPFSPHVHWQCAEHTAVEEGLALT